MRLLISKETLSKYVQKHNWLAIAEVGIPTGRQIIYVTPTGHFVVVLYNLKGDLENILQPVTIMPAPMPMKQIPGLDLPSGLHRVG